MKGVIAGPVAAALSVCVLSAPPAAADPTSTCPDNMLMIPTSLVVNGDTKDKNGNGFVCGKAGSDGQFHGGPDDVTDDIVI
jgi:hypothetical protein